MNEAVTVPLPAELREHVREQAKSNTRARRRWCGGPAAAPSDRRLLYGNNPLWASSADEGASERALPFVNSYHGAEDLLLALVNESETGSVNQSKLRTINQITSRSGDFGS